VKLLEIPIRDGRLTVDVARHGEPASDDPADGLIRQATLRIDAGVVQVVEPHLYILDEDVEELDACLSDVAAKREASWLEASGRSPYLLFRRSPEDVGSWEIVFHDAPASGARVRVYTELDWVEDCRKLLETFRGASA
jgi:hypothetical protein